MQLLRKASLDLTINVAWALLVTIDAALTVLGCAWKLLASLASKVARCLRSSPDEPKPLEVVIVGASFAGLAALRVLGHSAVNVTLVDFKDYFEYTPGILRCFVDAAYFARLSCKLPAQHNKVVTAEMKGLAPGSISLCDAHGQASSLSYDYLILALGSTYQEPIKPTKAEVTLEQRTLAWQGAAARVGGCHSYSIVGGGGVGVELAGELLDRYPSKSITIVDMSPTILPGFDHAAAAYAARFLEAKGVQLVLGQPIREIGTEAITLDNGTVLAADIVFKCVGVQPNTAPLKESPLAAAFGFRQAVTVNDHLQVEGHPTIFCVGDMMTHRSRELKLGHTAEVNAQLAAHNVLLHASHSKLLDYPRGVVHAELTPKIYCLSLGKYDASLGFNGLVINGWIAALFKWLLEWTKVAAAEGRPIGILFWEIADFSSCLLARTVLPTKRST